MAKLHRGSKAIYCYMLYRDLPNVKTGHKPRGRTCSRLPASRSHSRRGQGLEKVFTGVLGHTYFSSTACAMHRARPAPKLVAPERLI